MRYRSPRVAIVAAAVLVLLAVAFAATRVHSHAASNPIALKQLALENAGAASPGSESNDYLAASQQFDEARTAPSGIVNPGAYGSAVSDLGALPVIHGTWADITAKPYDSDHPAYRDYFSNSSGGSGLVTGRITGLASNGSDVWAAGADGGVWYRSGVSATSDGSPWQAMDNGLISLSTGDLEYSANKLWYATGEANTGGTAYVGSGVYVNATPTNPASSWTRVGNDELESTTIGKLRFGGGRVWAATLRGVWYHSDSTTSGAWTLAYAPHPENLPSGFGGYAAAGSQMAGATYGTSTSSESNAPYKNIVNDIAIDPNNANHVVAAIGWRSGDSYNGFYESTNAGVSWVKVNPTGAIPANDIGYVTFAFSGPNAKKGSKLYAINQSPTLLNKLTGTVNSLLDGIYVSSNGSIAGPWSKIADSTKLANSGSALKQAVGGKGYGPGVQAWYNQFLAVDPNNADHVYAGLEEVYETQNAGSNWNTVGPYWNFYFSCWNPGILYPPNGTSGGNGCPLSTHSDQHAITIGGSGASSYVVVGNDGGAYVRPLNGSVNGNGNATDWHSLNDGSLDALQYYAVGVGAINHAVHSTPEGQTVNENTLPAVGSAAPGVLVSGGLQDNGGSLIGASGSTSSSTMVSNFGGDGGDVLVDPTDGCNIVQEYVYLSMTVTQTCAHPTASDAFLNIDHTTSFKIDPNDTNARFIAPFVGNTADPSRTEWLAGGNHLWVQSNGFAIRNGAGWGNAIYRFDHGRSQDASGNWVVSSNLGVATALALNGNTFLAGWCGTCNNRGFSRGLVVGTRTSPTAPWTMSEVVGPDSLAFPNRYISGVAISADQHTLYVALNGFSRRFTEGPGAGIGHVYKSTDGGVTWTNMAGFPDIPANSIQSLSDGSLVVGTDLGVVYWKSSDSTWYRLGDNLPLTVDMDVELGPDNNIYAATHGRGIWSIAKP